jgi:lambda family phage minor tail protein L
LSIRGHVQQTALGARVTLFHIDLSSFNEADFYITGGPDGGDAVSFGGQVFSPWPVRAEGFEVSTGKLPSPMFTLANLSGILDPIVEQNEDLIGARLTRIRTYDRYLDGGVEPNGDAYLPLDIYEFASLEAHDNEVVSWRLSALIDQEGIKLPGRQCVRDYCDHITRRFVGGSFDYTGATCPYTGAPKDVDGNACAPADEVFSKRLGTCCQARFGETAALPFRGFPGVARLRGR